LFSCIDIKYSENLLIGRSLFLAIKLLISLSSYENIFVPVFSSHKYINLSSVDDEIIKFSVNPDTPVLLTNNY